MNKRAKQDITNFIVKMSIAVITVLLIILILRQVEFSEIASDLFEQSEDVEVVEEIEPEEIEIAEVEQEEIEQLEDSSTIIDSVGRLNLLLEKEKQVSKDAKKFTLTSDMSRPVENSKYFTYGTILYSGPCDVNKYNLFRIANTIVYEYDSLATQGKGLDSRTIYPLQSAYASVSDDINRDFLGESSFKKYSRFLDFNLSLEKAVINEYNEKLKECQLDINEVKFAVYLGAVGGFDQGISRY